MRHAVVALVLAGAAQAQVPQWIQCPLQAESLIPIPNLASIAGFEFFMQALVLYHPSAVAVSNGLVATVGY